MENFGRSANQRFGTYAGGTILKIEILSPQLAELV